MKFANAQRWLALFFVLALCACSKQEEPTVMFLPTVKSPLSADQEALRRRYCDGVNLQLSGDILNEYNFRTVFNCANYDGSLEGLRSLITSPQFPDFLHSMSSVLRSNSTQNLRETLRPWLQDGPDGESKADRLLPTLSDIIKNPAFQDGLPLLHRLLDSGKETWASLLPAISDAIYQERFPDTFDDLLELGSAASPETKKPKNSARFVKDVARTLKADIGGKSGAMNAVELLADLNKIELPGTSVSEFLDQMNVKGVFLSLYQESGRVRGETINPKLNADPDENELREGLNLTPAERQRRALRQLFTPGDGGADAPIVQLAGLINEFHKPHPMFMSSLARWLSGNGQTVSDGLFDYVAKALIRTCIPKINLEGFLGDFAAKDGSDPNRPVDADAFEKFLASAFTSEPFGLWLGESVNAANKEQFGPKNAKLLAVSKLREDIVTMYELPEVAAFGRTLLPKGKKLPLTTVIKRYSNLHRGDKLQLSFKGKTQNLELHMVDSWMSASHDTLGESIVVDFAIQLVQTNFTDFASDFATKSTTISEWYYQGAYGNPGTTEALAGYAVKELSLLDSYYKNKDYLLNDFGPKVFQNRDDLRAWRLLVEQIPNIWLYVKSGMARSGSDLTRALAEKDKGYLINTYVSLLSQAYEKGLIRKGVALLHAYYAFADEGVDAAEEAPYEDILSERRRISRGTDALRRVLQALSEPAREGEYESTTLQKVLAPLRGLVEDRQRSVTERFLLSSADELLQTPDDRLNRFLDAAAAKPDDRNQKRADRRESIKTIAELLKKPEFPKVIRDLNDFFQEDAVKPALDFLARKIDDGSLSRALLFLRCVLGIQG